MSDQPQASSGPEPAAARQPMQYQDFNLRLGFFDPAGGSYKVWVEGATPGGGTISISGGAALAGLAPAQWRLEARADQMGVEYPKDTQTVVDAQITLEGNRKLQILSGNAQVRRASYTGLAA